MILIYEIEVYFDDQKFLNLVYKILWQLPANLFATRKEEHLLLWKMLIEMLTPIWGESYKIVLTGAFSCQINGFSLILWTCKWTLRPTFSFLHFFQLAGDTGLIFISIGKYLFCTIWRCFNFVKPMRSIKSSPKFCGLI